MKNGKRQSVTVIKLNKKGCRRKYNNVSKILKNTGRFMKETKPDNMSMLLEWYIFRDNSLK